MKRAETDTGYDALKMESRREVDELAAILCEWIRDHTSDNKAVTAEQAIEILEAMGYDW